MEAIMNGPMKLGEIRWYAPWRRYCFNTCGMDTFFDSSCLKEVTEHIDHLMALRKAEKDENHN